MIEEDATVAATLLMNISKMLRVVSGRRSGDASRSQALCGMTTLGNYNTDVST